jgi:hypothetical protein
MALPPKYRSAITRGSLENQYTPEMMGSFSTFTSEKRECDIMKKQRKSKRL